MRIASLLPSATETLCRLGAQSLLVARSHECELQAGDAPSAARTGAAGGVGDPSALAALPVLTTPRVTFTDSAAVDRAVRTALAAGESLYLLNEPLLAQLQPDLIITQDLCEVCSIDLPAVQRAAARLPRPPRVLALNPTTIDGVLDDVLRVAAAAGREADGERLLTQLRERMAQAQELVVPYVDGPSVAVLDWTDPLFIAGHWTPQLVERAGGRFPLNPTTPIDAAGAAAGPAGDSQRTAGPSRAITPAELVASRPEALVIVPCGLTLAQARREAARLAAQPWFADLPAARAGKVAIVDGNLHFSRPSPGLVDALEWLVAWLNQRPEAMPAHFEWALLV